MTTETNTKPLPAGHYLDKTHLYAVVARDKAAGKMSDELAKMLMLIVQNYSNHPWFSRWSFRDDMESHAIEKLVKVWTKFDETKSKQAFSYLTTCTHRAFVEFIKREHKQVKIKQALAVELGVDLGLLEQMEGEDQSGE